LSTERNNIVRSPVSAGELKAAYEATDFWVEDAPGGPFCVGCGELNMELDRLLEANDLAEWVYITACNPDSRLLPEEENTRRMHALEELMHGLPCVVFHGKGVGTQTNWPSEPSLLVLGIGERQALEIGARFGQKAIVIGRRGEPARLAWIAP
jgi:hypothetical protein